MMNIIAPCNPEPAETACPLVADAAVPAQRLPISVIVVTYNEEANIAACLETIVGWAHEVFVVDSDSTDRTVEIATQYNAKIYQHPFETYSRKRNWAQTNLPLANEWVCHIDADERVSPAMVAELQKFFSEKPIDPQIRGLVARRPIVFEGRHIKHGGIYPSYNCRIFKRQFGRCEDREYDQHFLVDGETLTLEVDLLEVTATSLFYVPRGTTSGHSWSPGSSYSEAASNIPNLSSRNSSALLSSEGGGSATACTAIHHFFSEPSYISSHDIYSEGGSSMGFPD
ncbi:MAG: glycosyltransferase family 2 protein [Nitrospira sp.]|nr:glycosyltransferase family 2 protein [Nitrospira sp.]